MKIFLKTGFVALAILSAAIQGNAQTLRDYGNKANNLLNGNKNGNSGSSGSFSNLSNTDIVSALREALQIGAQNSGKKLSLPNGYFGNQLIKILMPPEARNMESTLRDMGLGNVATMSSRSVGSTTCLIPMALMCIGTEPPKIRDDTSSPGIMSGPPSISCSRIVR